MEKLHKFLKLFMFVEAGSCCGRILARYIYYIKYPKLYEMQSAPWYTSVILAIILTAVIITATAIAYFVVGHIIKKRRQEQVDEEA